MAYGTKVETHTLQEREKEIWHMSMMQMHNPNIRIVLKHESLNPTYVTMCNVVKLVWHA